MMSTKKVKTRPVQQTAAYSVRYHERPESNLVTIPIGHISDALRVFGEKTAKGYTPLVLVPACRGVTDLLMCMCVFLLSLPTIPSARARTRN